MKNLRQNIVTSLIITFTLFNVQAQEKDHELDVMNHLATPSHVSVMPVSALLNAPGNEAMRAFFFNPIKDKTLLKGKRIAVIAADGFEEIELTGPVWYFSCLLYTSDAADE